MSADHSVSLLEEYGLPELYVEMLAEERGIDRLWKPQVEALEAGLLDDENFLVVAEAGAGKTLLAEMAMFKQSLQEMGCGVFLVPFKPLAEEKANTFSAGLSETFNLDIGKSIGSDQKPPQELFQNDIVVFTYEKFSYYLRNYPDIIDSQVNSVVIDEFQTLKEKNRGPKLEITVTKLLQKYSDIKLIGLSATTANADEVAEWLDGNYVDCRGWRPNPLYEGIYADRTEEISFYHDGIEADTETITNNLLSDYRLNVIADFLLKTADEDNFQALVFAPTRSDAEEAAVELAEFIHDHPKAYDFGIDDPATDELSQTINQQARHSSPNLTSLVGCLKWGTAFYHAGIDTKIRSEIENGFREGALRVICSTSNLGSGINLPVDRVFVLAPRYGTSFNGVEMTTGQYKNLAGRAGRPSSNRRGESILFADGFQDEKVLKNTYITGDLEAITSKLEIIDNTELMLDLIREFGTSQAIHSFLVKSLLGFHDDAAVSKQRTTSAVSNASVALQRYEMIEDEDSALVLTRLGEATSKELVDPQTVHRIRSHLTSVQDADSINMIDLFAVLCGSSEFAYYRLYHSGEQTRFRPSNLANEYDLQHLNDREIRATYTSACVVAEWLEGSSIEEAFETYDVSETRTPADVYERLAPEMTRVLRTVLRILEAADAELYDAIGDTAERIADQLAYGVDDDGVEFAKAEIINGRSELRELREKLDIETIEDLAECPYDDIAGRMRSDEAVRAKRAAVNTVCEGRERIIADVMLDVRARGLSEQTFERLLESHTTTFENTCVELLEHVNEFFVEPANEQGNTREPECRIKIRDGDRYLETDDGTPMMIAIECKSKKDHTKSVGSEDAVSVTMKAPEADVKLTVGTPDFANGTHDDAIKNEVCAMTAPTFAAFIARAINGELSKDAYLNLFDHTGIVAIDDVRSVTDE